MSVPCRFAVCNELFKYLSFDEACRQIRDIGYSGIEIAPFTLAENPAALSRDDRAAIRQEMTSAGLAFVGLHWLLVSPPGLHATTRDREQRRTTWSFLGELINLCSELASPGAQNGGILVFGSPQQRSAVRGMTPAEATAIFVEELARAAKQAESRGVTILLEPLSPNQTDVVNSLEEAVAIVTQIGSPAVATMFDVHNALDETAPHADLVGRYASHIRHVHVNEVDGREPGTGQYDFRSLLAALAASNYPGWISLEVFDFSRDGGEVATRALEVLTADSASSALSQTI